MRFFVVGGAGFIGSHLVERLALQGEVTVYDNLSVGRAEFLARTQARLVRADALSLPSLEEAMAGHDWVFHLSANPEARWGLSQPNLDLEQGTQVTWNVLEASRRVGISKFVFASSGTVYGNTLHVCKEGDLRALPISLYGASKWAGEALVSSYVECFGLKATICRFGNVVGPRATHGAILDFCRKLLKSPNELEVLGDGQQQKPYLHVEDCVEGLLFAAQNGEQPLGVYNLAPRDVTKVESLAKWCVEASPFPQASIRYTGGSQGWRGDVPLSRLDPSKLADLGFSVRHSSDEAAQRAVKEIAREVFGS